MLVAMMGAAVGDDVFGEDPTVNELERYTAALFGLEAGLFVPTGTMANQIAVRVHCRPQDEVLLERTSHICLWEAGGAAALSGATCHPIDGRFGLLSVADLEEQDSPRRHALGAHAARGAGEHTQPRRGHRLRAGCDRGDFALGAGERFGDAPRRRAHLERDCEDGRSRTRVGPECSTQSRCASARGWEHRSGRCCSVRGIRSRTAGGFASSSAERCGRSAISPPRVGTHSPTTSTGSRRITRTQAGSTSPTCSGRGYSELHSHATGSGSESGLVRGGRAATAPRSRWPSGSKRPACSWPRRERA